MESQGIESLIELINRIKVTDDNEADIDLMKELIDEKELRWLELSEKE